MNDHSYFIENERGVRTLLTDTPEVTAKELVNRALLTKSYMRIIATKRMTVIRRKGVQSLVEHAYKYGGRNRGGYGRAWNGG